MTKSRLINNFRPELINRFDDVIMFKPLTEEDLENICKLYLKQVSDNLLKKNYVFNFSDQVIKELLSMIDTRSFGARPLRRLIQEKVDNRIAILIINGTAKKNIPVNIGSLNDFDKIDTLKNSINNLSS